MNELLQSMGHLMPTRGLLHRPTPRNNYITSTLIQFEPLNTMKHTEALLEIHGVSDGHRIRINNDTWQAAGLSGGRVS
jgi:hypothetical protein